MSLAFNTTRTESEVLMMLTMCAFVTHSEFYAELSLAAPRLRKHICELRKKGFDIVTYSSIGYSLSTADRGRVAEVIGR